MGPGHAPGFFVSLMSPKWICAARKIEDELADQEIRYEEAQDKRAADQSRAVDTFNNRPTARARTLVVVNSNKNLAVGIYERRYVIDGGPHMPGVMQHAPRIHDVEPAERRQKRFVYH